jgi:NAD(P)-dependent dehydrogenase (short-subunit alcohol dehydrogenase family)
VDLGLDGKVTVLTGGGRKHGIGWATIVELREAGAKVVMGDIAVDSVYREMADDGSVIAEEVDLSKAGNPEKLIRKAVDRFGRLDILINNLGTTNFRPGFLGTTDEDWEFTFKTNFMSNVRASRAAMPHLIQSKGVIISVASTLGISPTLPALVDYGAFKSATLNLNKALSEEFSPQGVRFMAISPGAVLTPHWTRPGGTLEMMAKQNGVNVDVLRDEMIPKMFGLTTGRMVSPQEIAAAILFAASGRAGSLTGTQILVDGGSFKAI